MSDLDIEIMQKIHTYDRAYQLCNLYVELYNKDQMTPEYEKLILNRLSWFRTDSQETLF